MEHNPDRICVWPGYFNAKTSRRGGRRVPRDSSVLKPDLEGLYLAARKVGLKKISPTKFWVGSCFLDQLWFILKPNCGSFSNPVGV